MLNRLSIFHKIRYRNFVKIAGIDSHSVQASIRTLHTSRPTWMHFGAEDLDVIPLNDRELRKVGIYV